ncbi:DUF2752 domain-containing protein [Nocardioides pantholopis]|uniref:DUF2752 domain-containing protein n=1 Tax=Nocardioides pantholopis TaxID=2483798 RepID=UPI001F150133|nr:DUF2752 domain-containing protein [Nocardioides pantholopis]
MSQRAALDPPRTRRERMLAPALTIGGLGAATVALHVRDPHVGGSWGVCPTALMGFACPGCGGLRAVNDLTHLDLAAAASSNLAFVVAAPFLVVGLALWALGRWRGRPLLRVPAAAVQPVAFTALVLLLVFSVLRNLPAGSWLAP